MIFRALGAAALALASAPAQSPLPASAIEAALMRHIATLADDAMEGRRPGTPGGDKAVRYIAGEMQAVGLSPGAAGGNWYQPVDLVERKPLSARAKWRIAGRKIDIADEELVLLGSAPRFRLDHAPVIYAGYGLPDNLKGVDVAGAIVLLLPGKPEKPADTPSLDNRRSKIARSGAAAVLTLMASETSWRAVRSQYADGRIFLAEDEGKAVLGAISYPAWTRLLREAGRDPRALQSAAADPGFVAVPVGVKADLRAKTTVRRYRSVNVIGRLAGAARADEAVVIMAHWDHLGICRAAGVTDRICNGAVDNASGIASMLEIARGLAQGPRPARSLLFVATTAEELGLLGARAFVKAPPLPLGSIVAGLNLDTVAIAPKGAPVAIIGRGMTRLDPFVDATARALGREVDTGTAANAYVARQDGWELMGAGVPAIMLGGAFSQRTLLERFFASRYHGPADDLAHGLELGGAAEDVVLHVALARLLADPAQFPASAR